MLDVALDGTDEEEPAGRFLADLRRGGARATVLLEFTCEVVPLLRESGWVVEMDDDYLFKVVEGDQQWYAEITEGTSSWFDLELGVEIDGERHSLLPILVDLLRDPDFELGPEGAAPDGGNLAVRTADGRMLLLPGERVRAIVGTLIELYGDKALPDGRALPLSVWSAPLLTELDETLGEGRLAWSGGDRLRELGRKLRGFHGMRRVEVPPGFHGKLRPYQREALNWLQFLREHELAGVLADDMGLGKTVQVLAHLLEEKRCGRMDRPSLVVAPTSVVSNWKHEAERFAPGLRVLVLHGQSRKALFGRLAEHDLVLTTYPLLSRDREQLQQQPYHVLILDEAQFVKNAKTKAAQAARELEARHRLCLTGTPMENHLGELWSLFHFAAARPARRLERHFRQGVPHTRSKSTATAPASEELARRVCVPSCCAAPRTRSPPSCRPKTEIPRTGRTRGRAARPVRDHPPGHARLEGAPRDPARKGLGRSPRRDPRRACSSCARCAATRACSTIAEAQQVAESAKLRRCSWKWWPEMIDEGRRILLFSQFTSMLKP